MFKIHRGKLPSLDAAVDSYLMQQNVFVREYLNFNAVLVAFGVDVD